MKTHDWIIVALLATVMTLGALSYFVSPKDVDGAKEVTHALIDALGMVLAFKFGVHVASPTPGSTLSQVTPPLEPAHAATVSQEIKVETPATTEPK